ncbi:hypothetical protein [Halorussus sp. MSC15.2]|uniref:hypothetical protein n=1 Tax=Halorussus sp. MSC15.2 TaxID=2283638 RepID=UPI0028155212|nr:hypothetical protein [Halorussus sp. MSC15.2]
MIDRHVKVVDWNLDIAVEFNPYLLRSEYRSDLDNVVPKNIRIGVVGRDDQSYRAVDTCSDKDYEYSYFGILHVVLRTSQRELGKTTTVGSLLHSRRFAVRYLLTPLAWPL